MLRRGILIALTLGLAVPCLATPVTPGMTVAVTPLPAPDNEVTLLAANVNVPFFTAGGSNGTMTSAVFQNTNFDLDFAYQITVAPDARPVVRETDTSFLGYSTDVDYFLNGSGLPGGVFVNGATIPNTADSDSIGNVVGFSFGDVFPVAPGQSSVVLVIRTDARTFVPSSASVVDIFDSVAIVPAFEPTPTVVAAPEPASMLLLSTGLIGMGARRWRNRRQRD